jgi:hypothetical protein
MAEFGLYWWRPGSGGGNPGDEIAGPIFAYASGRSVCWANAETCDGIAIGSIFHPRKARSAKRKEPLFVWGSGTLAPSPCRMEDLAVSLAALRGPRMASMIAGVPDVPFGDPGLFAAEVWPGTAAKRHRFGLVPHRSELKHPAVRQILLALEGSTLIDVTDPDIAGTLERLSSCERIVSSSLHGLVLADSYGIPSLFWNPREEAHEWKYRDYFEGVGRFAYAALGHDEILGAASAGGVDSLPFSLLDGSTLTRVLCDLRTVARQSPDGSF